MRPGLALSDVLGGQVLAWLGGTATLLGIVLFLAMAISHGWIGEEARVVIAGRGLAADGRGVAAPPSRPDRGGVVMVGVATTGLFATLIVASTVYALVPDRLPPPAAASAGWRA